MSNYQYNAYHIQLNSFARFMHSDCFRDCDVYRHEILHTPVYQWPSLNTVDSNCRNNGVITE